MIEPVVHRYGPDPAQFGELSLPGRPALGTAVIIHGGFWQAAYDLSLGGDAALGLMGGGPDERPEAYRLADPMARRPTAADVVCLHSRRDQRVPYSYSERYVAAAGGRASLLETFGLRQGSLKTRTPQSPSLAEPWIQPT